MPYAKNGDINIYYEVEGEGPPLVLLHGFTQSLEAWRENGYIDGLKNDYQLILLDARGHGRSDKPHTPEAYNWEFRAQDVIVTLNDLNISQTHYFGYSMGSRIGFELARRVPDRMRSLILIAGGARYNPDGVSARIKRMEAGPEAYIAEIEKQIKITPERRAEILANDIEALIACQKAVFIDIDDYLSGMTMPFLLFAGDNDPVYPRMQEVTKILPDATFFSIPGVNHVQSITRSDVVLPHVKEFLARVSKASS